MMAFEDTSWQSTMEVDFLVIYASIKQLNRCFYCATNKISTWFLIYKQLKNMILGKIHLIQMVAISIEKFSAPVSWRLGGSLSTT